MFLKLKHQWLYINFFNMSLLAAWKSFLEQGRLEVSKQSNKQMEHSYFIISKLYLVTEAILNIYFEWVAKFLL